MRFFPPSTNGQYSGARISVWFLGLSALLTLAPALIHSFLPDGGAEVIAHLDMGSRRDLVIAVFRWEGATQMAMGLGMLAVAVRYQSLTPLFISLIMVERGLMALQGWVLDQTVTHHPPEHYASVVSVLLCLIFLPLSLSRRRTQ